MEKNHMIVCEVIHRVGRIDGRKKAHKIFHIAKALKHPIDYYFKWGNFGAFSPSLQSDLDLLSDNGIITQNPVDRGGYTSYQYMLPDSSEIEYGLETFGFSEKFFKLITKLNLEEPKTLELWSSILFLQDQGEEDEKLVMFLNHLKPQFSKNIIKQNLGIVETLKRDFCEGDDS